MENKNFTPKQKLLLEELSVAINNPEPTRVQLNRIYSNKLIRKTLHTINMDTNARKFKQTDNKLKPFIVFHKEKRNKT